MLAGDTFPPNGRLALSLVGIGGRTVLGSVRTDGAGAFRASLAVPRAVAPGAYRLVAVAGDGDEVASLEVAIAPPTGTTSPPVHEGMAHEAGAAQPMPSSQPLDLRRARSDLVTGTAIASIVLALGLAIVLLRNPQHRS